MQIQRQSDGQEWFYYLDKGVTNELLNNLCNKFLQILDQCPTEIKKKLKGAGHNVNGKLPYNGTSNDLRSSPGGVLDQTSKPSEYISVLCCYLLKKLFKMSTLIIAYGKLISIPENVSR